MLLIYSIIFSALLKISISAKDNIKRPHIIFIVADDLGKCIFCSNEIDWYGLILNRWRWFIIIIYLNYF